jgi:predicted transposase/invertase (TIGR01784 family)
MYQVSKLVEEQLRKGDHYRKVNRVVCIVITEFTFITENNSYHNDYVLYDRKTGSTFSSIMNIQTLELSKLPEESNGEPLWDWLKFLDSDDISEMEKVAEKNQEVSKAVIRYKELTADETERRLADAAEDRRRMEYEFKEDGREEGREETRAEIANRLAELGKSEEEIAEILGAAVK